MAQLEAFAREVSAVIFVDLTEGTVRGVRTVPQDELRSNAGKLAAMCRVLEIPTVFAKAPLPDPEPLREILREAPTVQVVGHTTNDCFGNHGFASAIAALRRKQLLFAGIATDVGVGLTALSAVRRGFQVGVVTDVCGTISERAEQAALMRMAHSGVELTAWSSLLGELAVDYTRGAGVEALALLRQAWQ